MADTRGAGGLGPGAPGSTAVRHLLVAVHQALSLPPPRRAGGRVRYLELLDQRARVARASIARLLTDPRSGDIDFLSEGDHVLHLIAELVPGACRHASPLRPRTGRGR